MAGIGLGTNADLAINDPTYATQGTAAALQAAAVPEYDTYTVVPGDSLSIIAGKILGDPSRWNEIFNINPQIQDPNVISVGQVLNVPAGAIASSTAPDKSLPGPVHQAIAVAMPSSDQSIQASQPSQPGSAWYNSPTFIVVAAGIGLALILLGTQKKIAQG